MFLLVRKESNTGDCTGIRSSGSLWVIIYGLGCRRCSQGDGPSRRVILGDYVIVVTIDCDKIAIFVVICNDNIAG